LGQGSGGVITPSPYENIIQTYFTKVNSDYYGVQYMLDSPVQVSAGAGWSAYQNNAFGLLLKLRSSGIRETEYDPLQKEDVPRYRASFEASFDHPFKESDFRSFKLRVHWETRPKGLSMSGVGVLVSEGNLLVAGDRTMDRRLEIEASWMQVAGGYIMPLSPRIGGVNLAVCGAVDLLGAKYQSYYSNEREFVGAKIASIGWTMGVGWNAAGLVNLGGYVGGEWSFSVGGLRLETQKTVLADIGRSTIYFGWQATGHWVNLTGGIQMEWEYLDFQQSAASDKAIRYYLGANVYFRR
jgi:hypothetical protein